MASFELMSAVQEYEEYIKTNGINERVIDAYCEAVKTAVVNENDVEYGLKISKRCKESLKHFVLLLLAVQFGIWKNTLQRKSKL